MKTEHKNKTIHWWYLLVCIIGLTIVGMVGYSFHKSVRMNTVYAPLIDAAKEIKLEATTAHLLFEEIIIRKIDLDIEDVWKHLEQSDWYARAMLEGGKNAEGTFIPLDDAEMRRKIHSVRTKLVEVRNDLEQSLAGKINADINTDSYLHHDSIFQDFIAQADEVETRLKQVMANDLGLFRLTQITLFAVCSFLSVFAGIVFFHFERNRTKNILVINDTNKRLKEEVDKRKQMEEELKELNEILEQRVSVRTKELTKTNKIMQDEIAERKMAEEKYEKKHSLLNAIIEGTTDTIFMKNLQGRYLMMNSSGAATIGKPIKEIVGKHDMEIFPPDIARDIIKRDQRIMTSRETEAFEENIPRKDNICTYLTTKSPYLDHQGNVIGLIGISCDITERKSAENKLIAYQQKLQTLVFLLSTSEGRERSRIAEDLHGHVGQNLIVAKLKLRELQKRNLLIDSDNILNESCEIIEKTIQDIRTLIFELGPPLLYKFDFVSTMRWLIEQYRKKHKLNIDFKYDKQLKIEGEDLCTLLFKSVRELFFNILKHANAHQIKVNINSDCGKIIISVEDDGIGFNPHNLDNSVKISGGLGLFSIRERLKHIGGEISVDSKPDHGTRIILSTPLMMHKKEESLDA